jgi:hypothetical protein
VRELRAPSCTNGWYWATATDHSSVQGNSSGSLAIFTAIRRASSLVSSLAAELRPRRTSEAISAISKSWKSSPREGSSLYRLVGDFVSEDYLLVVSLVKVFVAIAHQFRSLGVGGGGERSPSKGLRIAVVSAAALLPSVTAELRSNAKLLLSVPFYL